MDGAFDGAELEEDPTQAEDMKMATQDDAQFTSGAVLPKESPANERKRCTIQIDGPSYRFYKTPPGSPIYFSCIHFQSIDGRNKYCKGGFKLSRYPNNPDPQLIADFTRHDCCGKTIPTIVFLQNYLEGIVNGTIKKVNKRTCPEKLAEMKTYFMEFKATSIEKEKAYSELSSINLLPPVEEMITQPILINQEDDRELYTVVAAPPNIRDIFINQMQGLIPLEGKQKIWDSLQGGNHQRKYIRHLKEKDSKLHDNILEEISWYKRKIEFLYPKLTSIVISVLLSEPKAPGQTLLHVDYDPKTQRLPPNMQPVSAIIAIEGFTLDVVRDEAKKKLTKVIVEPGDMIVFINKCIHRGGANSMSKPARRIFLYWASEDRDIDVEGLTSYSWNNASKKYSMVNPEKGRKSTSRRRS